MSFPVVLLCFLFVCLVSVFPFVCPVLVLLFVFRLFCSLFCVSFSCLFVCLVLLFVGVRVCFLCSVFGVAFKFYGLAFACVFRCS